VTEVTHILSAIEQGDANAASRLLPLVYAELRRLAAQKLTREGPGQTLEATGLVHEAYLRLVGEAEGQHWNSRGHFFAAAEGGGPESLTTASKVLTPLYFGGLASNARNPWALCPYRRYCQRS
jgi:hypothetical protein